MTSDKSRKTVVRQRVAHTGEPYSVARRAVDEEGSAVGGAPDETPEDQYAREAAEAGVPAEQVEAELAAFRLREAAERARARADWAEATANLQEEHAMAADDAVDEAAAYHEDAHDENVHDENVHHHVDRHPGWPSVTHPDFVSHPHPAEYSHPAEHPHPA